MGCDIHAHIEILVNDEWIYYTPVNIARNYDVFAKMAGVRNYESIEAISKPRGLPKDISVMTRLHRESLNVDGHSDSYLDYNEIVQLIDWMKETQKMTTLCDDGSRISYPEKWEWSFFGERNGFLFGNTIYNWKKHPEDYPDFIKDIRLVFWFDN